MCTCAHTQTEFIQRSQLGAALLMMSYTSLILNTREGVSVYCSHTHTSVQLNSGRALISTQIGINQSG